MLSFLKRKLTINLLIVSAIFFIDRFSKIYVISESKKNLSSDLFLSKFLNISLIWNEGIAFGLLSFEDNYLYNFLTILITIIIIIIFFMILNN